MMKVVTFEYTLTVSVTKADGEKLLELPLTVHFESRGGVEDGKLSAEMRPTPASQAKLDAVAALVRALEVKEPAGIRLVETRTMADDLPAYAAVPTEPVLRGLRHLAEIAEIAGEHDTEADDRAALEWLGRVAGWIPNSTPELIGIHRATISELAAAMLGLRDGMPIAGADDFQAALRNGFNGIVDTTELRSALAALGEEQSAAFYAAELARLRSEGL